MEGTRLTVQVGLFSFLVFFFKVRCSPPTTYHHPVTTHHPPATRHPPPTTRRSRRNRPRVMSSPYVPLAPRHDGPNMRWAHTDSQTNTKFNPRTHKYTHSHTHNQSVDQKHTHTHTHATATTTIPPFVVCRRSLTICGILFVLIWWVPRRCAPTVVLTVVLMVVLMVVLIVPGPILITIW